MEYEKSPTQYDGEKRGGRKSHRYIQLDHLQQVNNEQEYLMMRIAKQYRYGYSEKDHDEQSRHVGATRHPTAHKTKVFARDCVAHETFVLLLFGNVLYAQHEDFVVAEEFVQNEFVKARAKAFVSIWIERD